MTRIIAAAFALVFFGFIYTEVSEIMETRTNAFEEVFKHAR